MRLWKVKNFLLTRTGVTLAVILLTGTLLTQWMVSRADQEMRNRLILQASMAAKTLDVEAIQTLTGTASDLGSPHYQRMPSPIESWTFDPKPQTSGRWLQTSIRGVGALLGLMRVRSTAEITVIDITALKNLEVASQKSPVSVPESKP